MKRIYYISIFISLFFSAKAQVFRTIGNQTILGSLTVSGGINSVDFNVNNFILGKGNNQYIFHSQDWLPNNPPKIFIAPKMNGTSDWDWNKSIIFDNAGSLLIQGGSIGVGTTSPQASLHVAKFSTIGSDNVAAILGNDYNHWTNFGGTLGGRIRGSNEGFLVVESNPNGVGDKNLYLGATENVLIARGGGKVGIGTNSPMQNFVVSNSSLEGLEVYLSQPNGVVGLQAYNRSNSTYSKMQFDASQFSFTTGKVGIGTNNITTDALLTVNGTIHAKEVKVTLDGLADYVFSPDYSLMPLHKVEAFVKTNKHLPEIPSAAEVKEKGLSMGEMQNKLLQKIEELTLYVIELEKRVNDLTEKQPK